jgi:peptidoglycan/LPS O-acetylase OafA/YrhL
MTAKLPDVKQQGNPRGRLYFVDWLRVVLTINVVVMHSMLTYTSDGEQEQHCHDVILTASS